MCSGNLTSPAGSCAFEVVQLDTICAEWMAEAGIHILSAHVPLKLQKTETLWCDMIRFIWDLQIFTYILICNLITGIGNNFTYLSHSCPEGSTMWAACKQSFSKHSLRDIYVLPLSACREIQIQISAQHIWSAARNGSYDQWFKCPMRQCHLIRLHFAALLCIESIRLEDINEPTCAHIWRLYSSSYSIQPWSV